MIKKIYDIKDISGKKFRLTGGPVEIDTDEIKNMSSIEALVYLMLRAGYITEIK